MARQFPPAGFAGHTATSVRVARKKRLVGKGWLKADAPMPIRHGCQIEADRRGGHVQAVSHRILHRFLPWLDLIVSGSFRTRDGAECFARMQGQNLLDLLRPDPAPPWPADGGKPPPSDRPDRGT